MNFIVHTDGGARGNPGPAATGVFIEEDGGVEHGERKTVAGFGTYIGETTNNVAEYTAVIEALTYLKEHANKIGYASDSKVMFYLDSTLVVNQLIGLFKIKEGHLRELVFKVHALENELGGEIRYSIVRREFNKQADFFVNKALDEVQSR
jgi:ribonuclease HI